MSEEEIAEPVKIKLPKKLMGILDPYRYKAAYGGRGTGKSHGFATALLALAANKPMRILCAREIQLSIKDSVKQLLEDKISAYGMQGFWEITNNEIRGVNGSLILFAGLGKMTTDQLKSLEGIDVVWVEEAQSISARSMEVLIPTIRKEGSELWFTWNPRSASDPVDVLFRGEVPPKDALILKVNPDDNPWFPNVLREEMEYDRENRAHRYEHIWFGEYEPQAIGAIWNRTVIRESRRLNAPELSRILVSVDPAVSNEAGSDENGILVVGQGTDGRGYVLEDATLKGTPSQWAVRAVSMLDKYDADGIVVEVNQGGNMVRHTLETVRPRVNIIEVRATKGKHVRAEPISALYSAGQISHVGTFEELEDQMCKMTASGYDGDGSPDRVDALVWGFTELFPRIVSKADRKSKSNKPVEVSWMG